MFPHIPLLLLYYLPLRSFASASGSLALFLDEICREASTLNPSVNIPLNTCLVTPGAQGIAIKTLPPCDDGSDAELVLFQDTSCADRDSADPEMFKFENCYFDGPNGVEAVLFACGKNAGGAVATSTTTVYASRLPIAQETGGSGSTPEQSAPLQNTAISTSIPSAPSSPSKAPTPSPSDNNDNNNGSGTSGLSRTGQIALGVALPVAAVVVALLAWWFPCHGRDKFR
ncbi:MAG: hypothetical protein LQ342_003971 [Letrouitia transgressa]|nr:MAG: hypothetical protein LQ342_003971 [Letrouitia transgressa]